MASIVHAGYLACVQFCSMFWVDIYTDQVVNKREGICVYQTSILEVRGVTDNKNLKNNE